jgi:DNA-directed RNA polymerase specialized sigma24 family protein
MRDADPQEMELDPLARCCEEETERFFRDHDYDPGYCFELFRRALEGRDERAWEEVYRQFSPLAAGWAADHPEIVRGGGGIQEFINRAFERMWAAIPPPKFQRFRELRSVLAYLKMCVHSAIVEEARKTAALRRMVDLDELPPEAGPTQRGEVDSPVDRMAFAAELRETVWHAVNSRLQDDRERLVVHCLFELDLRPKGIFDRYPHAFRDVREIYTVRQVVLERLARDPALRALVREDA